MKYGIRRRANYTSVSRNFDIFQLIRSTGRIKQKMQTSNMTCEIELASNVLTYTNQDLEFPYRRGIHAGCWCTLFGRNLQDQLMENEYVRNALCTLSVMRLTFLCVWGWCSSAHGMQVCKMKLGATRNLKQKIREYETRRTRKRRRNLRCSSSSRQ